MDSSIKNARFSVEVSNLRATESELEKFVSLVVQTFKDNATTPTVSLIRLDSKGSIFEIKFIVKKPSNFRIDTLKDWLHSLGLVGWQVEGTFIP